MILEIKQLNIGFASAQGLLPAVKNLSLQIQPGETLGLVGESGSGKSVTALSIMRLLPPSARISGEIFFSKLPASATASTGASAGKQTQNSKLKTQNLIDLGDRSLRRIRGSEIAMIFQEPMTSLNPVFRCGAQVAEAVRLHRAVSPQEGRERTFALFEKVKLPDPKRIFRAYPHELSGGQKQRVMIAMALAGNPALLLADEPTTALDVSAQKSILELLRELREQENLSMLFISHDLGVISEIADRVAVMSQGEIVEAGEVSRILKRPDHPYTKGLIACRPSLRRKVQRLPTVADFFENASFEAKVLTPKENERRRKSIYEQSPILEVKNLSVRYPVRKRLFSRAVQALPAVEDVSFEVFPGEIFGLAGASGCGKTTLGRVINRLLPAQSGSVWFRGLQLDTMPDTEFRPVRREIQMVFQDPYSSLNPRMLVGDAILEPMKAYKLYASEKQRLEKVVQLLETVGLRAEHARRYPREFSGGQRQRICLARALALQPKLLVCDEIVSALDVSVQATILNLLLDLQEEFGLSMVFISHDLSVIKQMCDRVMVMNQGKIEAIGYPEDLFENSKNEYVRNLIAAIPGKVGQD